MTASFPSLANSLIQALHQPGQERLLDLVRNPLRLTLLCITWDGTLPETQAQLYENYLKKFYDWNQNLQELRGCAERCQTNITVLKNQVNQQLGELAKAALDLPQERFRLSQALVEKYLGEELDDKSLCYLALQLGWLNRAGKDNRGKFIFAFYHATFQEYFAALAVDDWDYFFCHIEPKYWRGFKPCSYRIFEEKWKNIVLLWFGRDEIKPEKKNAFIKTLAEFNDQCGDFYSYKALFLACLALNEFPDCLYLEFLVTHLIKVSLGYYFDIEKLCLCITFPAYRLHESKSIIKQIYHPFVDEFVVNQLIEYIDSIMMVLNAIEIENYENSIEKFSLLTFFISLLNLKFIVQSLNLQFDLISILTNDQISTLEIASSSLINSSEYILSNAIELLCGIKSRNQKIDLYLRKLTKRISDDKIKLTIAKYFKESSTLIEIYQNTDSDIIRLDVAKSLLDIEYSDVNLITEMLIDVIHNHHIDDPLWFQAIMQLIRINPDHPEWLEVSPQIKDKLKTGLNFYSLFGSYMIAALIKTNKDFKFNVQGGFRNAFDFLYNESIQNDATNIGDLFDKLNIRHYALWQVAQVMSYQEFYEKWHNDQFSETTEIDPITHP